jgi:ABC-type nitrate/sulfonate/bicarbonate transport system permease component
VSLLSRAGRAARRSGPRARGLVAASLAIVAAWALAALLVHRPFLPSPWAALSRLAQRLADGSLALHLVSSARRVGVALALAAPAAAALGLASGRSGRLDALVSPFVYLLHPLPKVAFLPVIMLFLGLGDAAKIFLIGLIIFGQVVVSARDAARAVSESLVESMRSLGASRWAMLRHLVFPSALPSLLSALRVGLGTAIAVLFIAEGFASETGLGWYIIDAWTRVDYPDMYAAIVALSLFGLLCYLAVDAVEALACRWRRTD